MGIGNIVSSAFVGAVAGLGIGLGVGLGVEDGVPELLQDAVDLTELTVEDISDIYQNAPESTTHIFDIADKLEDTHYDLANKIRQDLLPQGEEWKSFSSYVESVPENLPDLPQDIIDNNILSPEEIDVYNYTSANTGRVADIVEDNMQQLNRLGDTLGDEALYGALSGAAGGAAIETLRETPQWTKRIADSAIHPHAAKGKA